MHPRTNAQCHHCLLTSATKRSSSTTCGVGNLEKRSVPFGPKRRALSGTSSGSAPAQMTGSGRLILEGSAEPAGRSLTSSLSAAGPRPAWSHPNALCSRALRPPGLEAVTNVDPLRFASARSRERPCLNEPGRLCDKVKHRNLEAHAIGHPSRVTGHAT